MLDVQNITQSYPAAPRKVLESLSFPVMEGEIFVITGASGSGKSSLLRILAGLEEPKTGSVRWKGDWVTGQENLVKGHPKIAFLDQEPNLLPNLTVRENLARELRMYEANYQEQRTEELLQFCQIERPDRLPRQLSGGEQQRIGLARAVARLPEVLLLDEPFAHLDYPNKQRLRRLIQELVTHFSLTIIIVTHHIRESFGLADRLLVLEAGKMAQLGDPISVYDRPVNPRIARLFGATNVLSLGQIGTTYQDYPPETLAYLPPEFVQLSHRGGQAARVETLDYLGGHFLIGARLLGQKAAPLIYFYTFQHRLTLGHTIQLRFVFSQLHIFKQE